MRKLLKRLRPEEKAEGAIEYALLFFLVSMTVVSTVGSLASRINRYYSSASSRVETASRDKALTGCSLGYGVPVHTDAASNSKNPNDLNTQ